MYRPSRQSVITISWAAQLMAALLLCYAAWHKLTGQPASVATFQRLGLEPIGRYSAAVTELIVAACMVTPVLVWAGALSGLGLLAGAIFFHATILGISVGGDNGLLFRVALACGLCCALILYLRLALLFPELLPISPLGYGVTFDRRRRLLKRIKKAR